MEKETIKENIEKISGIEKAVNELKALFSSDKKETPKEEVKAEEPVIAKEEAKVEFNHEEFTKNFNDYKTSNDEKFKSYETKFEAFEAQIKSATETIASQGEILKQTFALVEKLAEAPVAMSKQAKKEGVKKDTPVDYDQEMAEWRKKYIKN